MHGLVRRVQVHADEDLVAFADRGDRRGLLPGALGGALDATTWTYASHPLLPQMPPAVQGWMPTRANWLLPVEELSRAT